MHPDFEDNTGGWPSSQAPCGSVVDVNEAERRLRAMARLVQAVQELSLARSLSAVTAVVRKVARELTGADGATFILRDRDQCHYVDEDAVGPLWRGQRFPLTACVSGWAMLNARAVVIPDIFDDPRVPVDAYRPTFVKSLVMVPIRIEQPIGAIGTYWARPYWAAPFEVELLQNLAHTTAVALENVQVYGELERRVEERTSALRAANESLESFSYSVSHDLRNPLTAILGYVSLAEQEPEVGSHPELGRHLGMIRNAGCRMQTLIADLLRMAALDRAELRNVQIDLSALAREVYAGLSTLWPHPRAQFRVTEGLVVRGDPELLRAVLDNLLSNALKYSSRQECPVIELGRSGADQSCETFFVRDNGVGFDPRWAGKLFTPFTRLHAAREFPGTGVGLASARRIIERHGGRIWASAVPGEGATFCFSLPKGGGFSAHPV